MLKLGNETFHPDILHITFWAFMPKFLLNLLSQRFPFLGWQCRQQKEDNIQHQHGCVFSHPSFRGAFPKGRHSRQQKKREELKQFCHIQHTTSTGHCKMLNLGNETFHPDILHVISRAYMPKFPLILLSRRFPFLGWQCRQQKEDNIQHQHGCFFSHPSFRGAFPKGRHSRQQKEREELRQCYLLNNSIT